MFDYHVTMTVNNSKPFPCSFWYLSMLNFFKSSPNLSKAPASFILIFVVARIIANSEQFIQLIISPIPRAYAILLILLISICSLHTCLMRQFAQKCLYKCKTLAQNKQSKRRQIIKLLFGLFVHDVKYLFLIIKQTQTPNH